MRTRSSAIRRLCVTASVAAALILSAAATAAVDLTTVDSETIAKAVFSRHFSTVWNLIEPSYRKGVNETRWQSCVSELVHQSGTYDLKSVKVADTKRLHSTLPLLGSVVLIDVGLQVLYTEPGSKTLQAGELYAYWVKQKGQWHAVWLPSVLSAYRAGKCSPSSLY